MARKHTMRSRDAPDRAPRASWLGAAASAHDWEVVVFMAAAVMWPLVYAFYTDQVWEDFFITYRHSENLVAGHGLVYQVGERVHGFTSPLGVLLPAAIHWIALRLDMPGYAPPLWAFRVLSALAYAGGGCFVLRAMQRDAACGVVSRWLFAALYLLDIKAVAFSVNGMETGWMLLFLGWSFAVLQAGVARHWLAGGLAWSGLMWTRPDGCVYIAALALTALALDRKRFAESFLGLLKSAAVCTAIYMPWFAGASIYYGSPIPHTVYAKRHVVTLLDTQPAVWAVLNRARSVFGTVYDNLVHWPASLYLFDSVLGVISLAYWIVGGRDRMGRAASACFAIVCVYLAAAPQFPWYLPPASMLGWIVLARVCDRLTQYAAAHWRQRASAKLAGLAGAALATASLVAGLFLSAATTNQSQVQQALIEDGVRRPIGEWLATQVKPGDRVLLECLGYIGYFSGAKMLDHPGLCSPEVAAITHSRVTVQEEVAALRPEWVVLRDMELASAQQDPSFLQEYAVVRVFDHREQVLSYSDMYGFGNLANDARFTVLRRKSAAANHLRP